MPAYTTISSNGGNQTGQQVGGQIQSYTVQPGDSLSSIGSMFGVPWESIYHNNQNIIGGNPNLIQPGQQYNVGNNFPQPGGMSHLPYGSTPSYVPGNNPNQTGSLQGTMTGTQPTGGANQGAQPNPTNPGTQNGQYSPTPAVGQNGYNLQNTNTNFQYTPEQTAMLNRYDGYMGQLQGLSSMVDTNYNKQLAQINAQMGMLKSQQQRENDMYQAGVRQQGAASGLSSMTPEIVSGEVLGAVNSGIQKLSELTIKQNGLILDASKANIQDKMDILGKLSSLDKDKFTIAEQMKNDFFDNLSKKQQIEQNAINMNMPGIYDQIRQLPPDQQLGQLQTYAQQMGVPVSELTSAYRQFDRQEAKPISDARAQIMSQYPDVNWSTADLYNPDPKAFMSKLKTSKMFATKLLSDQMDASLKGAEAGYYNAYTNALGSASTNALPTGLQSIASVAKGKVASDRGKLIAYTGTLGQLTPGGQAQYILSTLAGGNPQAVASVNALTQLGQLNNSLHSFYQGGGSTNIFKGTASNVLAKLGQQTGSASQYAGQIAGVIQAYIDATGKPASSVNINDIFPSISSGQGLNNQAMSNLARTLTSTLASYSGASQNDITNAYLIMQGSQYNQ